MPPAWKILSFTGALLAAGTFGYAILRTPANTAPAQVRVDAPPSAPQPALPSRAPPAPASAVPPRFSTAIARVGPKAFRINGDVEPPSGKATQVIAALENQANQGNSDAALLIALKLMACQDALARQDDDATLLVEAQAVGDLDRAIGLRAQRVAECTGLDERDYRRSGAWLEKAAEAGNVVAQLTYAVAADTVLISPAMMMKEPERILAFKQRALRYLQMAAANGSVDALDSLGQSYRTGILVPQDDVRAYAYYLAGQKADGRIKPWDMEQLEATLSPRQRLDATHLAKEIYRACCELP